MSISVEYSFNSELAFPELAFEIRRRMGCVLEPDPEEPRSLYCGGFFGMHLTLKTNDGFVNDRELNFEDYCYMLSNKTWAGQPLRPIQVEVIALAAYFLHDTSLAIHRGMLTLDVSRLLARYEPRADGWYDSVGGKHVTYPEHLVDIKLRIDDPARSGLAV